MKKINVNKSVYCSSDSLRPKTFPFQSLTTFCCNENYFKYLHDIVTLPKTRQKSLKIKKNCQFVLENQYDLKPNKTHKIDKEKINDSKNGSVTRHLFSTSNCTNDNGASLRP